MAVQIAPAAALGMVLIAGALFGAAAQAGTVTYVYTDAQGTPVMEADAQGNITATYEYTPYGSQALGTSPEGPGYTGHVNDPDTGLVYMQARYYDPVAGRFLSVDPVGPRPEELFHFNRYDYANNNPVRYTDPDGRCPICAVIAVRFVVGASIDVATQHFGEGKAWGDIDLGDAAAAGVVSAAIPGLGNVAKTGYRGAKVVVPATRAITQIASKSANTANRAAKNAAGIVRNIEKIEGAAADVGKSAIVAGAHQGVKALAQSGTPEVTTSNVQKVIEQTPSHPKIELHQ